MNYTSRSVYEYISRQTNDPIVEWKTCIISGTEFPIYQSDLDFYDKISPTFAGQKFQIPTPTLCPEERQRRRLSFRNERKLYKRKCDATGENIISIYSPDKPYKVYDQKVWRSDARDPMSYGFEFDFSKTFRENFGNLIIKVPLNSLYVKNSENCDYNSVVSDSKNCYLCTSTGYVENVMYSTLTGWLTNCLDSYWLLYSENCYQCIDCDHCYGCSYLYSCTQCTDCLFCIGLNNKTNCILNKQYSKEEFEKMVKTLDYNKYYYEWLKLQSNQIQSNKNIQSENIYGSQVRSSKSSSFVFDVVDLENCKYMLIAGLNLKDSYDCSGGDIFQSILCYECGMIPINHQLLSCYSIRESQNLLYCFNCYSCSHCFGCIGLRNKQYCIFNKQYTKEEYEVQVAKIIAYMQSTGEWGEFFYPSLSPFGYNETVAQEYFPINQGEFKEFGYTWSHYSSDPVIPAGVQTIEKKNYNDEQRENFKNNDEILKQILICEVSGRPYRIIRQELEFYRKHDLAIPSKHPDIRHEERMKLRPGRTLHLRTCDCCGEEMLSVYAPKEVPLRDTSHPEHREGSILDSSLHSEGQQKVYCEECYQKEVFG